MVIDEALVQELLEATDDDDALIEDVTRPAASLTYAIGKLGA